MRMKTASSEDAEIKHYNNAGGDGLDFKFDRKNTPSDNVSSVGSLNN